MNKTLEKQILTIIEVIKKMQTKLDNAVSYDTEIKELQSLITKIDKNTSNSLDSIFKAIDELNNRDNKDDKENSLETIKSELMSYIKPIDVKKEIDSVIKDYATKNELNDVLKEIKTEKIIETIKEDTKFVEPKIKIGKVRTIQAGDEASVELRKVKDTYILDFNIPRGVSGRGMPGKDGKDGSGSTYILPTASTSVLGGVKVDGTSVTILNGVISSVGGAGGKSISTIEKTSTLGLVDTYTITYTDSTTSTFNITNGEDGAAGTNGTNGTNGLDGTDGNTPYIESGYWYIDGTSTGVLATGPQGPQGEQGIQGPQGIQGIQGIAGTNGTNGTDGADAAEIISAAFDGNDIKFTKDDATTFSITDAKITLKGEKGNTGDTGPAGADGLTTSVNGVTQVAGAITIDPDDLDDTATTHKFVTSADITKLSNLSGTNTGDETVANNLTTTASGSVLDARQGKILNDKIVSTYSYLFVGEEMDEDTNDYYGASLPYTLAAGMKINVAFAGARTPITTARLSVDGGTNYYYIRNTSGGPNLTGAGMDGYKTLIFDGTAFVIEGTTIADMFNLIYPIGTIYETTSTDFDTTTKMGAYFGGTWEEYGSGRVLVAKSADTEFDTIGETGGAKTSLLTRDNLPYSVTDEFQNNSGSAKTGAVMGSIANGSYGISASAYSGLPANQPHNNLQPYIVVYRYRRVS